ncbi:MAG: bifunctional nuclease domain-containing protein, partial [Anaerolineales bacterium]
DTFFGNIVAETDGRTLNIDSRPSDALAIAVRTHVPIMVARSVMNAAGIVPEEDIREKENGVGEQLSDTELEETEERLSVFHDFLDGLDSKDDDDDSQEDRGKKPENPE